MTTTYEAKYRQDGCSLDYTPVAAAAGGEVRQHVSGKAGVCLADIPAAALGAIRISESVYVVQKTASQVWLDGTPLWWDHSANKATCVPQFADRDFYLGFAVGDAASADTTGKVKVNAKPEYIIDAPRGVIGSGGGDTAIVLTAGTPGLVNRGGMLEANFSATAEAQKVDWLSRRSFPISSKWIAEALVEIATAPDNAAVDIDVGVASGTHATDFESVAEFAAFHLDGNDNNIDVHSDDGTTDVAPEDSTVDWAAGTPVLLQIDGRDHTNIKFYINGVRVASGTTFTLTAGTGPLKLIFHMEKTSDDSPGIVQLSHLALRIAEQA